MLADLSTSNKSLASVIQAKDPIVESRELIETLFLVLKDCDICTAKLKKKLNNNMAGATTTPSQPTGHADTTAPSIGMLYLNEREERTST